MPQKNSYDYARKNLRASLSSSCFEKKKAKGKSAAIHDSTISERQRMCKSHAAQSYVALRPSGLLRAKRRSCRTKRDNSRRLSPLLCPCYQPHYHRCLPFPGVIKALHSFLRIKQNENVCRRSWSFISFAFRWSSLPHGWRWVWRCNDVLRAGEISSLVENCSVGFLRDQPT